MYFKATQKVDENLWKNINEGVANEPLVIIADFDVREYFTQGLHPQNDLQLIFSKTKL